MALVRWDPASDLASFDQDFGRLMNAFFGGRPGNGERRWTPAMDLVEREDHYLVRADLPGLAEEDIEIEVKDNVLTISGERQSERKDEDQGYFRLERSYGHFQRMLTLPEGVDPARVTANFDRGVLELKVPKPAERKPHRIAIGDSDSSERALEGEAAEK